MFFATFCKGFIPFTWLKLTELSRVPSASCSMLLLAHSSVQFSCSVVSDSLRPHESQHTRPPCPSPTPWVHSDSCPSSQWCHPAISSSVVPFSSCPRSLPASKSFPMSQLFPWGGQSTAVSALSLAHKLREIKNNFFASFPPYYAHLMWIYLING